MESDPKTPKSLPRRAVLVLLLLGVSAFCGSSYGILYTYGCKVTVTQVRAGKELRDGKEYVDPELPKNDERALKREYKKTYKSYELLAKDNSSAGFNEPLSLPLANGKTLILSFESHRQAWINMKLQIGADVRLMRVSSGQRGLIAIRYAEEGDDEGGEDALVIILCPRLVQATRQ